MLPFSLHPLCGRIGSSHSAGPSWAMSRFCRAVPYHTVLLYYFFFFLFCLVDSPPHLMVDVGSTAYSFTRPEKKKKKEKKSTIPPAGTPGTSCVYGRCFLASNRNGKIGRVPLAYIFSSYATWPKKRDTSIHFLFKRVFLFPLERFSLSLCDVAVISVSC